MRARTVRRTAAALALLACLVSLLAITATGSSAASGVALNTVIGTRLLGYSVEHRPIWAYHLGDPSSPVKAVIVGQIHGDEHAGVYAAAAVVHGPPIRGIDLWVVPTMNPDGNAHNRHQNADGVDLNRNWPDIWAPLTGYNYSGPRALSEPETRAMYTFLGQVRPTLMVSMHQPFDGVDTTDGYLRNRSFALRLSHDLGLSLKAFNCWSICHGSMTGWVTDHQKGAAVTVEFPVDAPRARMTQQVPGELISAFGGAYDSTARHNPVLRPAPVALAGTSVQLQGWAYDPDRTGTPLRVTVYDGTRLVATASTSLLRADVNALFAIKGDHGYLVRVPAGTGTHRYCVHVQNLSYGTGDVVACASIHLGTAHPG